MTILECDIVNGVCWFGTDDRNGTKSSGESNDNSVDDDDAAFSKGKLKQTRAKYSTVSLLLGLQLDNCVFSSENKFLI